MCKIIHDYTMWNNLGIRVNCNGYHYLTQVKECKKCGKIVVKNIKTDGFSLFHGLQVLSELMDKLKEGLN